MAGMLRRRWRRRAGDTMLSWQSRSCLAGRHGGGIEVTALTTQTKEAQKRAEANFRKKELQAREASKAMAEYEAARRAEREKTARLRVLREARQAAEVASAATAAEAK